MRRDRAPTTPALERNLIAFGEAFGLTAVEDHRSAGLDGIVRIEVVDQGGRLGYIPYTDRPINWHTDGYYNFHGPDRAIRAMLLHCQSPSASGGVNRLLDPEIAYIRLRDQDASLIEALMRTDAMTIPASIEAGGRVRPENVGPVFFVDPRSGALGMRFTARRRNVVWREDSVTQRSVEALLGVLRADPLVAETRLAAGQGLVCNNVLHEPIPTDLHGLQPAMEEIHKHLGRKPEQVVADGGFTNRASIEKMAEHKIDFYGSLPDPQERSEAAMKSHGIDPKFAPSFFILQPETRTAQCPAGKSMKYLRRVQKRGDSYESYRAQGADCLACPFQKQCCPSHAAQGRIVSFRLQERADIAEFRKKMASEDGQRIYQRRGATAEFPFAWIKERMKLRKFRLFGLRKAGLEALWAILAYNVMLWIRAHRLAPLAA